MKRNPNIVVVGGGNGASRALKAARLVTPNVTGVIAVTDDGGHSGELRDEDPELVGVGDLRRAFAALTPDEAKARAFNYRYADQSVEGNLVLARLTHEHGSLPAAVKAAAKILDIVGTVVPVTSTPATLVMEHDGHIVSGEHQIGSFPVTAPNDVRIYTDPAVSLDPEAALAYEDADLIVIASGSLYTSLIAALVADGTSDAITASEGRVTAFANLEAEVPNTPDNWHVGDHARALQTYTVRPLDALVFATNTRQVAPNSPGLGYGPAGFANLTALPVGAPLATIADGRLTHDIRGMADQMARLV